MDAVLGQEALEPVEHLFIYRPVARIVWLIKLQEFGVLCQNGHRKLKISLEQEQNFFLMCAAVIIQHNKLRLDPIPIDPVRQLQEISNMRPITLVLSVSIKLNPSLVLP